MGRIISRPDVEISSNILEEIALCTEEQGQVVVHCLYTSLSGGDGIRIWPTSYLFDQNSDHVSELVHAENITMFPEWTWVRRGESFFTLIFTGLPKSCTLFDLIEDCNGAPGSFRVIGIHRNQKDVYYVSLN